MIFLNKKMRNEFIILRSNTYASISSSTVQPIPIVFRIPEKNRDLTCVVTADRIFFLRAVDDNWRNTGVIFQNTCRVTRSHVVRPIKTAL